MSKKFLSPIKLAQGTSNPSSGSAGEIFYNTTDQTIYTHNGTGWATTESSLPAGTMVQWGGSSAPANWLICDGSAISRTTYATLFAAIGTSYGTGDGSTTFNLPDLRGRVPVGKNGGSFGTLGATGGAETVALAEANVPSHTHTFSGSTNTTGAHTHSLSGSNGGSTNLGPSVTSNSNGDFGYLLNGGRANSAGDHSHTFSGTTSTGSGSGTAHNNLQPYQVVNYIIKTSSGTTAGDSPLTARVSAIESTTVRSVALGGTGASTLTGYVKGSGILALSGVTTIPVADGGTGATTAGAALTNLGAAAASHNHDASNITSGQLASARMPAGTVVGFNRIRTTARSAYGYSSGDVILSDLNISITPKFSNSLLLVQWQIMYESDYNSVFRVYRDNGLVYTGGYQGYNENDGSTYSGVASFQYDTDVASTPSNQMIQYFVPAGSTSTTTLQLSVRSSIPAGATFYLNRSVNSGGSSAYEIGVSTAVIWEISQ